MYRNCAFSGLHGWQLQNPGAFQQQMAPETFASHHLDVPSPVWHAAIVRFSINISGSSRILAGSSSRWHLRHLQCITSILSSPVFFNFVVLSHNKDAGSCLVTSSSSCWKLPGSCQHLTQPLQAHPGPDDTCSGALQGLSSLFVGCFAVDCQHLCRVKWRRLS